MGEKNGCVAKLASEDGNGHADAFLGVPLSQ